MHPFGCHPPHPHPPHSLLFHRSSRRFAGLASETARDRIPSPVQRMSQSSKPRATRIEEYWDWFAVALFLLVTVDLLTTVGATRKYGLDAEINPVIIWLFRQGLLTVVVAHLAVTVLAVCAFAGLIRTTSP